MPDLTGKILLNHYKVLEFIGRGGMAEVYRAWDSQRSYEVALKLLREDLAQDREFDRRFRKEAEALSLLAHRNIVRFYAYEHEGMLAFIVMDFITGQSLQRRIYEADGPLPAEEVLNILGQVAAALHYAHSEGLIHRDVKPGNIMLEPDGHVLLADFGIAKIMDSATTTTGALGTPAYMSPEQSLGQPVDLHTDIYSLGVVAYEMLAGRRPFVGESGSGGTTSERVRWEHVHAVPRSLHVQMPTLPYEVDNTLSRALAKDPSARYSSAIVFVSELKRLLGQRADHTVQRRTEERPNIEQPVPRVNGEVRIVAAPQKPAIYVPPQVEPSRGTCVAAAPGYRRPPTALVAPMTGSCVAAVTGRKRTVAYLGQSVAPSSPRSASSPNRAVIVAPSTPSATREAPGAPIRNQLGSSSPPVAAKAVRAPESDYRSLKPEDTNRSNIVTLLLVGIVILGLCFLVAMMSGGIQ